MKRRVAVIGGAGYVGAQVCREFAGRGHKVVAIAHANGRMILERYGIPVVAPAAADATLAPDVVVNLAYPPLSRPETIGRGNREILGLIQRLAGPRTRLIHVSTQAVFGFALEYPMVAQRIGRRRDYPYIEAKIELECFLHDAWGGRDLQIVRLGNVWGPASPTWTAALADRLMFGDPVGVAGYDGFCNATDVRNVASYLAFLSERPSGGASGYHHLAEFSGLRWSHWLTQLSEFLRVPALTVRWRGAYPTSLASELRGVLATHTPFALSRQLREGRFTASLRRSRVVRAAEEAWHVIRRPWPFDMTWREADPPVDPVFLEIMSAERRFESQLIDGWTAPVDSRASWDAVAAWLARAGYA